MLKAIAWVEKNPYDRLFADRLAAKPGDRKANLAQSIQRHRDSADTRARQVQRSEIRRRLHQGAQEEQDRRDVLLEVSERAEGICPGGL